MEYRGSDPEASNRGCFVSENADWVKAYARQADKDFVAWELYEKHPEAVAAECHKLHFLQMACEKLCKAHREAGDDVISPLNWSFTPSRLCNAQAGRTFLKLLREAINSLL
jgi:hypothetical protein